MELIFRDPDGGQDPADMSRVIELVRSAGADYWNGASGDAGLEWFDREEERHLTIFFLGAPGFHLVYDDPDRGLLAAMPAKPPAKPRWVDIRVGGNPKRITSGQAVGRGEAERILIHFAEHGGPDPGHSWQPVRWPDMS